MKITMNERVEIRTEATYTISGSDLRTILKRAIDIPKGANVTMWVDVPGGGDWSNEELDLDDHPVHVRVTTVSVKEKP